MSQFFLAWTVDRWYIAMNIANEKKMQPKSFCNFHLLNRRKLISIRISKSMIDRLLNPHLHQVFLKSIQDKHPASFIPLLNKQYSLITIKTDVAVIM